MEPDLDKSLDSGNNLFCKLYCRRPAFQNPLLSMDLGDGTNFLWCILLLEAQAHPFSHFGFRAWPGLLAL